jgi:serine/threonine protein kinase
MGAMIGAPDHTAPEHASDSHTADMRADVYSLGCTLYYLLAGRLPFPGGSLAQKLLWHQQAEQMPVEQRRTDLPARLGSAPHRVMARKPAIRYQTPGEVAAALTPGSPVSMSRRIGAERAGGPAPPTR